LKGASARLDIPERERRLLQVAVAVAALVPVGAGGTGAMLGLPLVAVGGDISADSQYRYLSGLLLGIGLLFWASIPNIERQTVRFRVLGTVVFFGGLARLCGLAVAGIPDATMLFGLVMELAVTPAICLWQARIAARMQRG
jgi:hypothetical protein